MPKIIVPAYPGCPVRPFTESVLTSAAGLARALKRLRRAMHHCDSCIARGDCPVLLAFNAKFQTALTEVTDEWQLTPPIEQ